jgi:hypothetical protein
MSEQPNHSPENEPPDNPEWRPEEEWPEEWKEFKKTFLQVYQEIYEKMQRLGEAEQSAIWQRLRAKQKGSFASVPNPGTYLVYHLTLGGGADPFGSPNMDFEGEHSLLEFYKKVLDEIAA